MAQVNPLFFVVFFIAWATMMGSYFHFALCVAPAALRNWAEKKGYQIIKKRSAGPLDWWSYAKGSGHQIYRLVIVDEDGQTRGGLREWGPLIGSVSHRTAARWRPVGTRQEHYRTRSSR